MQQTSLIETNSQLLIQNVIDNKKDVTLTFKARRIIRLLEFQCLFAIFFIIMENTISNIYSVDIYGQLHSEPSTAACSFLQKFDLDGGKKWHFPQLNKFLLFHLHYIRLNTD